MAEKINFLQFQGIKGRGPAFDEDNAEALWNFIAKLRPLAFFSPEEAAKYFNCDVSTIRRYEGSTVKGIVKVKIGYIAGLAQYYVEKIDETKAGLQRPFLLGEINKIISVCDWYKTQSKFDSWDELCVCAKDFINSKKIPEKGETIPEENTELLPLEQSVLAVQQDNQKVSFKDFSFSNVPFITAFRKFGPRTRAAILGVLFLLFLFIGVTIFNSALIANDPKPGFVQLSQTVELKPIVGKWDGSDEVFHQFYSVIQMKTPITGTFKVKNITNFNLVFYLKLSVKQVFDELGATFCTHLINRNSKGNIADFPSVQVTLKPNEEYLYQQNVSFTSTGGFFYWPSIYMQSNWYDIPILGTNPADYFEPDCFMSELDINKNGFVNN